jgi:hypothetical protein
MSQSTSKIAQFVRRIPGLAQVEGEVRGAFAEEGDLPIAGYDKATAAEIVEKLPGFSQIDLAKIDAYERRHENRTTVLGKLTALRGSEPWPGYDELTAEEIAKHMSGIAAADKVKAAVKYERLHKNRSTVIAAGERETAKT